jgi:hypothetical protein
MKDFRASIALALEDGGEDLAEESALWQESASNFLEGPGHVHC